MKLLSKLGSHYAIERFGIIFLVLVLCMTLVVGSITAKNIQSKHQSLSGRAVYTSGITMSQTKSTGTVFGLYSNNDHTRAFILLGFDDMSYLPTKANDYRLFISGCNQSGGYETLKSAPTGYLYLFGGTGYLGIYLEDVQGFPSQLMKIYLRAANFTGSTASGYSEETFNTYNQGQLIVNPGGSYAIHADFLEKDRFTPEDLVEEILCRRQEAEIKQTLRYDLLQIVGKQLLLKEYEQRVRDLNVVVPSAPAVIAQDSIYALDTTGRTDERLHYITSYGGGWVNEAGTIGVRNDDVKVYLDSPYVVPNGFDFDWQNGSISEGYLEKLTGTTTLSAWIGYIQDRKQAGKMTAPFTFDDDLNRIVWMMADGSRISLSTKDALTQNQKDIANAIGLLKSTWQDIYDLKAKYETEDLVALLTLESDFRNAVDAYTVNVGEEVPVILLW